MAETKASTVTACEALNAVIARLRRQGIMDTMIVAALAEVAIQAAQADKDDAQMHLDALAAIMKAAADARRAGTVINLAQALFMNA